MKVTGWYSISQEVEMSSPGSGNGNGGAAIFGMLSAKEEDVMKEYASSLEDLTVNSKPLINMLTILAEENVASAGAIVLAIERHLQKVASDIKLPVLYLIDSIMKNVGKPYPSLFTNNIVTTFCGVFEKVDEKTRAQMFKLRHTWNSMFPANKMLALDIRVQTIDPAWPVSAGATGSTSIHVNPRFLHNSPTGGNSQSVPPQSPLTPTGAVGTSATKASEEGNLNEQALRENLLKKKKELLELQQKKLELELMQTRKKLLEQEKQLEKTTVHLKSDQTLQLEQRLAETAVTEDVFNKMKTF